MTQTNGSELGPQLRQKPDENNLNIYETIYDSLASAPTRRRSAPKKGFHQIIYQPNEQDNFKQFMIFPGLIRLRYDGACSSRTRTHPPTHTHTHKHTHSLSHLSLSLSLSHSRTCTSTYKQMMQKK